MYNIIFLSDSSGCHMFDIHGDDVVLVCLLLTWCIMMIIYTRWSEDGFNMSLLSSVDSKCYMIKQNESVVSSDMLLVSDYFYTSNIGQKNLKPDTCEPYKVQY